MLINFYHSRVLLRETTSESFSTPKRDGSPAEDASLLARECLWAQRPRKPTLPKPETAGARAAAAAPFRPCRDPPRPQTSSYPPPACAATAESTQNRGKGADPVEGYGSRPPSPTRLRGPATYKSLRSLQPTAPRRSAGSPSPLRQRG